MRFSSNNIYNFDMIFNQPHRNNLFVKTWYDIREWLLSTIYRALRLNDRWCQWIIYIGTSCQTRGCAWKITKSKKNHAVEPSMFRRRNILEENVQAIISLEVEIRKSSTSRHLMHVSWWIYRCYDICCNI